MTHAEETVLLLHTLPGSSLSFSKLQTDLMLKGVSTVAFDLPGFGLSDKFADTDYTVEVSLHSSRPSFDCAIFRICIRLRLPCRIFLSAAYVCRGWPPWWVRS